MAQVVCWPRGASGSLAKSASFCAGRTAAEPAEVEEERALPNRARVPPERSRTRSRTPPRDRAVKALLTRALHAAGGEAQPAWPQGERQVVLSLRCEVKQQPYKRQMHCTWRQALTIEAHCAGQGKRLREMLREKLSPQAAVTAADLELVARSLLRAADRTGTAAGLDGWPAALPGPVAGLSHEAQRLVGEAYKDAGFGLAGRRSKGSAEKVGEQLAALAAAGFDTAVSVAESARLQLLSTSTRRRLGLPS